MNIPLSAPDITEAEIDAVVKVLRSGRLSLGNSLIEFEDAVAGYVGAQNAVAVNSGTSGLHLAVRALGISAGDEVLVPSFTFIAAANVILQEGATPIFVEVDEQTLNFDPREIELKISPRTKAIMLVHTFGRPAALTEILELAERHKLLIIEDACEALGATYKQKMVGTFGRCGVFAFYPNKQITTGEGGIITTDDKSLAEKMRSLRNQGRGVGGDWFEHQEPGFNYRLNEMSCALGTIQISRIKEILNLRQSAAVKYYDRLKSCRNLILPELTVKDGKISWFVFVVRLREKYSRHERDLVVAEMQRRGIGCGRYFAPIHLQKFFREKFATGGLSKTEKIADSIIALPFFNLIADDAIDYVCENLLEIISKLNR